MPFVCILFIPYMTYHPPANIHCSAFFKHLKNQVFEACTTYSKCNKSRGRSVYSSSPLVLVPTSQFKCMETLRVPRRVRADTSCYLAEGCLCHAPLFKCTLEHHARTPRMNRRSEAWGLFTTLFLVCHLGLEVERTNWSSV